VHRNCAGSHDFIHHAHNWLALINQTAVVLSVPALAWALWPYPIARLLCGAAAIGVVLYVLGWTGDPHGSQAGLFQRISIVSAQGWVMLLAVGVLFALERRWFPTRASG
jgi:hypothetical protein